MMSTQSSGAVGSGRAGAELEPLVRNWWMMAGRGVLALLFGVAIALWRVPVFDAVIVSFGTYAIADGILAIAVALPASAHHSISAEFDLNKPVKFTGTIKKVDWANPHIYTHVETKEGGKTIVYKVERIPKARASRKTSRASPSTGARASCWTGCSRPSSSTGPRCSSPTWCRGGRQGTATQRRTNWRNARRSCIGRWNWWLPEGVARLVRVEPSPLEHPARGVEAAREPSLPRG